MNESYEFDALSLFWSDITMIVTMEVGGGAVRVVGCVLTKIVFYGIIKT